MTQDILYALRTFRRAPLAALTIVATLALGLGPITVAFTVYSALFLRTDAVPNPDRLFAVERPTRPGTNYSWIPFTRREYELLRRDTTVFTDSAAVLRDIGARVDGRGASGVLVSGNFFHMLGVTAALGRTLTPADDERSGGRSVIVLSHRGWQKFSAADPSAIGRSLAINGQPYDIVGVMPEEFRGLDVGAPDYWAPLARAAQFRQGYAGKEDDIAVEVVGRLQPGTSREAATAALTAWASGETRLKTPVGRRLFIALKPSDGTLPVDAVEKLLIFCPIFFAFGLILMIGCVNVANLMLARGVARQREIGIRLALGASRGRITRQLIIESFILALASAAVSFAVARLLLHGAFYTTIATMPPEIAERVNLAPPTADWHVVMFLIAGAIVSTVFFGLMPALQSARLQLVRMMRGEMTSDPRPSVARHVLMTAQVAASAILLICSAVFLRGAMASATADPGFRTSDTVMVPITNEAVRPALLQEVTAHPSVRTIAASSPRATGPFDTATLETSAGQSGTLSTRAPVGYQFVSPEYFDVLGIDVVRGRGFTSSERTPETGVVVVSERIVRLLWPNREAVGQVIRLRTDESSRAYTVIGVVRDIGSRGLVTLDGADVYVPTAPDAPGTALTVRVYGDPEQARQALAERLIGIDPALDGIRTMRTLASMQAYVLQIAFWVTVVLGGLALALTLSGLFSVLSYLVEQRAKEIGVRIALGATTQNIAGFVLAQSLRPVVVGLVIGGSLAAALATVLMSTGAASQIGNVVKVLDPVAYGASLLIIVTACVLASSVPALRAARIDPVATLGKD